MSIVADFKIPVSALPGNGLFEELPDAEIEIERIVPTSSSIMPFFWVWDQNADIFTRIAEDDPNIISAKKLYYSKNGTLYNTTWNPQDPVIHIFESCNLTLLEGFGTYHGWEFKFRGDNRDDFANFQKSFSNTEANVHLQNIYELTDYREKRHIDLTSKQREALILAYKNGYYEEPRRITQQELGNELEITSRSISHRLRRGTRQLIHSTLISSD